MSGDNSGNTLWLILTNVVLGVVVVICLVALIRALLRDIHERRAAAQSRAASPAEDYALIIPFRGITMADGGEPVRPVEDSDEGTDTARDRDKS